MTIAFADAFAPEVQIKYDIFTIIYQMNKTCIKKMLE